MSRSNKNKSMEGKALVDLSIGEHAELQQSIKNRIPISEIMSVFFYEKEVEDHVEFYVFMRDDFDYIDEDVCNAELIAITTKEDLAWFLTTVFSEMRYLLALTIGFQNHLVDIYTNK